MAVYSSVESQDESVRDECDSDAELDSCECLIRYKSFANLERNPKLKETLSLFFKELDRSRALPHPVRLELQCLMFVIGHLFQPGHNALVHMTALLPRSIRIKFLLLLPAVYVHKMEATPITDGIFMDEIWETLYKERIPLRCSAPEMPDDYKEKYGIVVTWKEAYFNAVFSLPQCSNQQRNNFGCRCPYDHFKADLFYGIGIGKSSLTKEIVECFRLKSTLTIHHIHRCSDLSCFCLATANYCYEIQNPHCYQSGRFMLNIVDVLVESNIFLKKLTLFDDRLIAMDYHRKLAKSLCSVQVLTVSFKSAITQDLDGPLNRILGTLFPPGRPSPVKSVTLVNEFRVSGPHLIGRDLKHLGISLYLCKDTVLIAESHIRWLRLPVSICNNISQQIAKVINSQKKIESFTFTLFIYDPVDVILLDEDLMGCLYNVLQLPSLRKFKFDASQYQIEVSPVIPFKLVALFLLSPYPLSLTLSLSYPMIAYRQPKQLTANPVAGKTLEINSCTLSSHLVSFLPQHLVLKSLKLQDNEWSTVSLFTNLQSISVEEMVLHTSELMTDDDVKIILSLLDIVTAREWKLGLNIEDEPETVENLLCILTMIAAKSNLQSFQFVEGGESLKKETAVSIVKLIFGALSPAKPAFFDFAVSENQLLELKNIQDLWEESGKVKMKTIRVFGIQSFDHDYYIDVLGDMTEKLELSNKVNY